MSMSARIFLSYARADDRCSLNSSDGKGFVTRLDEHLQDSLCPPGSHLPTIWRDKRCIKPGDPFETIIESAIAKAEVLLVVLSRNWLASAYCRRELESFSSRWQHQGQGRLKQRIFIASKDYIALPERPALLQKGEYDFVGRVAGGSEYKIVLDILATTLRVRARPRNELCEA
jgi:TIR domain